MREHFSSDSYYGRHDQPAASLKSAQARIAELEAHLAELQQREKAAHHRLAELEARLADQDNPQAAIHSARLNVLLTMGSALLVTHDIESILDLIVRESTNLFPGTDGALLFLEDPQTRQLLLRFTSGTRVVELTLSSEQQVFNLGFMAPRTMLLSGPQLHDMLNAWDLEAIEELMPHLRSWPPHSALMAPLRDEHRCIGGLLLYRTATDPAEPDAPPYQPHDIPFVQSLADFSAVAITETYQRMRAAGLQRDLAHIQFLHREAQARLDSAQAQLLQSAKLAAIGELSASVAHEINNPLYAARNSLYLLEQDLPADAPQRCFLEIAQGELGRITRIITRMRDFYRPSRAELTTTDVNSLLRDTVEFVQTYLRHSQIEVITELTDNLPGVIAHMDQLRQVFLNIVLNACDAMSSGGCLRITTRIMPAGANDMATVLVHIADTGTGIPEEHMDHLFEPFYTTKPQGTGLGLAISAHIVTQHAGQISVESTVGSGSTFTISLPVTPHVDFDEER
jgi:two-component system NtrC family sensor kinase